MAVDGHGRCGGFARGPFRELRAHGAVARDTGGGRAQRAPTGIARPGHASPEGVAGPNAHRRSVRHEGGPIRFGGQIDVEGYEATRIDVTMAGENMLLRFPEGMRSLVDAELAVQGLVEEPVLTGTVTVRSAVYTRQFGEGAGLLELAAADLSGGAAGPVQPPTLPLRYDVRIVAPSTLEIRNSTARLS